MMGKTPLYLDSKCHEALFEIDVGVTEMKDQSQTKPEEQGQGILNRWNDRESTRPQKNTTMV